MINRLFRFLPKQAKGFLGEAKLWFSSILDFNDPFDATPALSKLVEGIHHSLSAGAFGDQPIPEEMRTAIVEDQAASVSILTRFLQEKFAECFGIVCFTDRNDLVPMWANYASGHKGFALEFDPAHHLFAHEDFGAVNYRIQRPQISDTSPPNETRSLPFAKSVQWSDEHEWRMVKPWRELNEALKWDGKPGRYLDLPAEAVRAVYFGCRAEPELTEAVESSCERHFPHVKLFQMVPSLAEYSLRELPWKGHSPAIPDQERPSLDFLWRAVSASYDVPPPKRS